MIKIGSVDECFQHIDDEIDFILAQHSIKEEKVIAFRLGGLAQYTGLLATYFMTHGREDLSERAQQQHDRVLKVVKKVIGVEIVPPEAADEDA